MVGENIPVPMGKFVMNSSRVNPFLVFGVENSSLNSCRITIHRENLPVISCWPSIYCIGLELAITLVLCMSI